MSLFLWNLKNAMPVSFRSELFTSYILTIFKQRIIVSILCAKISKTTHIQIIRSLSSTLLLSKHILYVQFISDHMQLMSLCYSDIFIVTLRRVICLNQIM